MITYLNYQSPFGRETVDEIAQAPGQPTKEFHKEVNRLIREYHHAGLAVYASRRHAHANPIPIHRPIKPA